MPTPVTLIPGALLRAGGARSRDLGGTASTAAFTTAVLAALA